MFRNWRKLTFSIAIGLPVVGLSTPASVQAQSYYGSIAYSRSTRVHGYSYDYRTRGVAEQRALDACESRASRGDCQVLVWFRNGCGALATSPRGAYGSGWGETRLLAEENALRGCARHDRSCRVSRWVCTSIPIR